jgi:hypothetical protein
MAENELYTTTQTGEITIKALEKGASGWGDWDETGEAEGALPLGGSGSRAGT